MDIKGNNAPIKNLPKSYSIYKKIASNITYYISQINFLPRKNLLSKSDITNFKQNIILGDIILCGNFQHVSGLFIEGVVTHAIAYIGKGKCIHAYAHGVNFIGIRKILRTYDTLVLLRPYWKNEEQKNTFKKFLISKIGFPYDYFFGIEDGEEKYFCTKLINDALTNSEYETRLESIKQNVDQIDTLLDSTYRAHRILKPHEMIYGNFNKIFYSENIVINGNNITLKKGKLGTIFNT